MDAWVWWAIATALLLGAELLTGTLVLAMIGAGTAAAAVAAGLGAGTWWQLGAFLVVSAVMLAVVRPVARRHMSEPRELRTGAAALVGSEAVIVDAVGPAAGTVRIGSDVWTARPFDGESEFDSGERVYVLEIRGATAMVG